MALGVVLVVSIPELLELLESISMRSQFTFDVLLVNVLESR